MISLDDEQYLTSLLNKLHLRLDEVSHDITIQDINYKEIQSYIHNTANLDKFELLNHRQELNVIDKRGYTQVLQRDHLIKMTESPYFGAIDFRYDGDEEEYIEHFYIGRFGFSDDDGNLLVNDWRAPISNMYYEFDIGHAYYIALGKKYNGHLLGKRQYKIENSQIKYILDSSLVIQDQVLQETLHQNNNDHMKTIVTTIQREQNRIVRNESAHTMIIHGVAGSGKTAVALHRIAYLLYKFRETLAAEHIFILSPNKVFSDYISTVLPELGEEPIKSFTLDELTTFLLSSQVKYNSFENEITEIINHPEGPLAQRAKVKSNLDFAIKLNAFLDQLDLSILRAQNLSFVGYEFEGEYILKRFLSNKKEPVLTRIKLVANDITDALQTKRNGELQLPKKKEIIAKLTQLLVYQSPFAIYEAFSTYFGKDYFVLNHTLMEFNDVYPYLMCHIYFNGINKFEHIKHFVLDEMQDYTPVQYDVIEKVFSCKRKIIGDFGQALFPYETMTKQAFQAIFKTIDYMELRTSYRSSYEISTYANKFTANCTIKPIERHGEKPLEIGYNSQEEMLALIDLYATNTYKSTAIICKTTADLLLLQAKLNRSDYLLLDGQTSTYRTGLILTTIQYAKGLEFDSVIIPFVNRANYSHAFDRGLLYIAATRAMHQLILLSDNNDKSPLI